MFSLDAAIELLADTPEDSRNDVALSDEVLATAATLDDLGLARLKARLQKLGVRVRDWLSAVKAVRKRNSRIAVEATDKPKLYVRAGELPQLTDAVMRLLAQRSDVFVREREFVTALSAQNDKPPQIVSLPAEILRVLVADSALWLERTDDGPKAADPPWAAVAAAVADPWKEGVRPLEAIIEAPTIRPDGSLLTRPGYDERLRVLYEPNAEFPVIPAHPTRENARDAYVILRDVFADFPCETESDRAALVAIVVSLICRDAIAGAVPAFGISANSKGTGKTKALRIAIMIATGRDAQCKAWPEDEGEAEKTLDTAAIEGARYVLFDNLERPFGGPAVCAYATATTVSPRDFGKKRTITVPWRGMIFATANNLQCGRDMDRRTVLIRMLFDGERPWLRPESDFRRPGHKLEEYVLENRPALVCAVLTMVRAWILADRPRGSQPTLGSFEAWSRFVPDCIEWASASEGAAGVNPIARMHEAEEEDEDSRVLGQILFALSKLDPDGAGLKARDIIDRLYPDDKDGPPDGFDDVRDAIEAVVRKRVGRLPDVVTFGHWLRSRRNQRRGDYRLVSRLGHAKTMLWAAERVSGRTVAVAAPAA